MLLCGCGRIVVRMLLRALKGVGSWDNLVRRLLDGGVGRDYPVVKVLERRVFVGGLVVVVHRRVMMRVKLVREVLVVVWVHDQR